MNRYPQLPIHGRMMPNAVIALIAIGVSTPAVALCVNPKEAGRWWNMNPQADPIALEITLDGCDDQAEQTPTSYGLKVFVQQTNGALYQRPKVKAVFKKTNDGKRWIFASVPTGGYVDKIWMRRSDVNGQERLYASIKHESLDKKPSAESQHWFSRQRVVAPTGGVRTKRHWYLVAKHSGKCLHQAGASNGNGDPITQWDCVDQPNVKLEKIPAGDGLFFLKFAHSGKCVHLAGASDQNATPITQWECINQANVKWREEPAGEGFSFFKSAQTNKCVHQAGATTDNGAPITQWDCVDQPNVQWKLVPAP